MRVDPNGPRSSPLDPAYVALALADATDRDQVYELLLRAMRAVTGFAAVLTIHPDQLRGGMALGDPDVDTSQVLALRISRNAVRRFEKAIEIGAPVIGTLATGEMFVDGLLEQLGGPTRSALVMPVSVAGRPTALIVAHRGDAELLVDEVAPLFVLAQVAGTALERLLAVRTRAATSPRLTRHETAYDIEIIVHDEVNRRGTLATLRDGESWEELADAIRELLRAAAERGDVGDAEQLELLLELGHLEAERLGRPDRAVEAWRSAQTIDAGDLRVLDALHAVLVRQARWRECAELLDQRIALADDRALRIELLLELAAISHERLEDHDGAIAAYERILNWEPEHTTATRELEALYTAGERWESLAALHLDRASRLAGAEDTIAALEDVIRIYEDQAGDSRSAFLVSLAVFRRDPDREGALARVARLGPDADAWEEVLAEATALAEEIEAPHPAMAARVWHVIAGWLADHGGSADDRFRVLERAYRLAPDERTADDLAGLSRATGRWTELVALLARRAAAEPDLERRSTLFAELGAIHDAELDEPASAIGWYEKAHADEPESLPVLVALSRLYRRREAWAELADLLPQQIAVVDPETDVEALVDAYVELGGVLADRLGKLVVAVQAYQSALELSPTCAPALEGVTAVYRATGQTVALLAATEAEVDAGGRDAQLARYGDVAAAWQDHGMLDRAAACWRKLLALDLDSHAAHRGLVRALRGAERWTEVATALRAAIEVAGQGEQRRELLLELAEVLDGRLDDVDGALAAARAAQALDPDHPGTLDTLARLQDRADQPRGALDALQRLLDLTEAPRARADLLQRMGHLHLNASDLASAKIAFEQVFALELENAGAYEGMARLHLMQDEIVAAGEAQVRAAQLSTNDHDKIRRWADAAWMFRHRLRDTERAPQCLHLILELDPDHADAKLALAGLLQDMEQWETLWPHLEQEVERVDADPEAAPSDRRDIYARAARCALELDRFATALDLYDRTCAIDAGPAMLIERAEALYRSRSLDAAAASFQTLALGHAQALDHDQLLGVYRRLAQIYGALGKQAQEQTFHQKVLELEPAHRGTLEDLAELHAERGRFDEAISTLRALVDIVPAADRVALLERIGDLYRDQLNNAPRAMSMYLEALELDAGNRRILQRLLDLQSDAGQWRAAVETIDRFVEHETEPARLGAYYLAAAEIRRNELRDRPGALAAYERALDELLREQPVSDASRARALETFRVVDELVTADRNWPDLEQRYLRMIRRLPKEDPVLLALWHALGELYRSRLKQDEHAIEAFEVAHALDPNRSPGRASVLAELYTRTGKQQPEQAAERAAKLVEADPDHPDAYRAIGRASLAADRVDEAWCVARALVFLKKANAEEQALYSRYRAREADKATGVLDEETWALVRHPDEDRVISAVFGLVWQGPVALRAGPAKSFDLKAGERMAVEDGTRVLAKIFRHAARVLGVGLPDVYVQPRRSGRLLLANCIDRGRLQPAVIVGRDLMTGYRDTEIASAVGAMLALLRPAYHLKLTLPTVDELEAAVAGAARVVGVEVGRPELEPFRTPFAAEIERRLTRDTTAALRGLVARLPERLDLARWRAAVDMTAQRAGLLVCGDLAAAARMLSTGAGPVGGPRPNQRVQDLVSYSVSPGYFAARAHLGVTVQ